MKYDKLPEIASEQNAANAFSYRTDNPQYKDQYTKLCGMIPELMALDEIDLAICDAGGISIEAIYSNGTESATFYYMNTILDSFFQILKSMLPGCENVMPVLPEK